MYCKNCGNEVPNGYRFCTKCGTSMNNVSSNEKVTSSSTQDSCVTSCKYCGAAIVGNEQACPYCGGILSKKEQPKKESAPQQQPVFTPPPPPSNYMIWAVLSTIFCCLPLGIVSIINASKVDSAYNRGDYYGAIEASEKAKNYAWAAVVTSAIFFIFTYIFG